MPQPEFIIRGANSTATSPTRKQPVPNKFDFEAKRESVRLEQIKNTVSEFRRLSSLSKAIHERAADIYTLPKDIVFQGAVRIAREKNPIEKNLKVDSYIMKSQYLKEYLMREQVVVEPKMPFSRNLRFIRPFESTYQRQRFTRVLDYGYKSLFQKSL